MKCYVCRKTDPITSKVLVFNQVVFLCFDCWAKAMLGKLSLLVDIVVEAKQTAVVIEERVL